LIQHLNKKVYRFQVSQFIVAGIHARAKEKPRVATVDDFAAAAEFDEVGLVFLVAGGYETVDFAFETDFFGVVVGAVPFC